MGLDDTVGPLLLLGFCEGLDEGLDDMVGLLLTLGLSEGRLLTLG